MKNYLKKLSLPLLLVAPFAAICLVAIMSQLISMAHADGTTPPALADAVLALFNAIQGHATAAVVLMYVFQVLRTNESIGILGKLGLQGKGLQITIAIITTLGYVFAAWSKGENLLQAAVEGLFTAGGAMLIYQAAAGTNASPADPAPITPSTPAASPSVVASKTLGK